MDYSTTRVQHLVDWFNNHRLLLLNPEGVLTWRSQREDEGLRLLILDLALLNEIVAMSNQFTELSVSFDIIPSDYAALSISWYPILMVAIQPPPELTVYAVDNDEQLAWEKFFTAIPIPPIPDIPSL